MVQKILDRLSFGGQFWMAALFYVGIGCVLLALAPEPPAAHAQSSAGGCPPGTKECHGQCVDETYVCCEDGTWGPSDTCVCCTGCVGSDCTNLSTAACADLEQILEVNNVQLNEQD